MLVGKPLTDAQRAALEAARLSLAGPVPSGAAESVEQRARRPAPEILPADIKVRIEIAPPSPNLDPILESAGAFKAPERVPIYFYAHRRGEGLISDAVPEDTVHTRVIFFIHGGGNVIGHPTHEFFLPYFVALLRAAAASPDVGAPNCVLIAPSYRLATVPENTFSAGIQDILAAYDYVISKGYEPSNVVIAGDSAGGNHAVVLTHLILSSNRPAPRGVIPIAPFSIADVELLSDHAKQLAEHDISSLDALAALTKAYIGTSGLPPSHPLISASFLPSSNTWPRTLILIGNADTCIDAARALTRRIEGLTRPVELVEYDGRPHGFWIFPHIFQEDIRDSAERIARFVLD